MTKEEYIKKCGGSTSKDLSDEQILTYFIDGNGGPQNSWSALHVKTGDYCRCRIDRAKAIAMLRQAFDYDKTLKIIFIDGEGVADNNTIPRTHITMDVV